MVLYSIQRDEGQGASREGVFGRLGRGWTSSLAWIGRSNYKCWDRPSTEVPSDP